MKKPGKKARTAAALRKILLPRYPGMQIRVLETSRDSYIARFIYDEWKNTGVLTRIEEVISFIMCSDAPKYVKIAPIVHTVTRDEAKSYIQKKNLKKKDCDCPDCDCHKTKRRKK